MNTTQNPELINLQELIQPTYFFNYNNKKFENYFENYYKPNKSPLENLIDFYYIVRDTILYNPYNFKTNKQDYQASEIIDFKKTYCIPKAILFTTIARKLGFPAKIGFSDVKNHISSQRFIQFLGTDIFAFHGYSEIYIYDDNNVGKWVKATPAFDKELCKKFNVPPLDFDGKHDAIFQAFDNSGNKFMEYVRERGSFSDFPFEYLMQGMKEFYPQLWRASRTKKIDGDMREEI